MQRSAIEWDGITVNANDIQVDGTVLRTTGDGVFSGSAQVSLGGFDTDNLSEGSSNQYFTNARARGAISVSGDLSYNSGTGVISFTNDAGDIESVTAGNGLTGGGTSGALTVNVGAGDGISVAADAVAVDSTHTYH